jgi:hypothetical protein
MEGQHRRSETDRCRRDTDGSPYQVGSLVATPDYGTNLVRHRPSVVAPRVLALELLQRGIRVVPTHAADAIGT